MKLNQCPGTLASGAYYGRPGNRDYVVCPVCHKVLRSQAGRCVVRAHGTREDSGGMTTPVSNPAIALPSTPLKGYLLGYRTAQRAAEARTAGLVEAVERLLGCLEEDSHSYPVGAVEAALAAYRGE